MPVIPLNLVPDLRPWHELGISFLYCPQAKELLALIQGRRNAPSPARPIPESGIVRTAQSAPSSENALHKDPEADKISWTPAKLPEPWQRIFSKLKPAPIIWTYMELGQDLQGQSSPERSAILKRLLGSLRLPHGSSAFLPLTLPGLTPQEQELEQGIFTWMIRQVNGQILILLGQNALDHSPYAGTGLNQYQEKIIRGKLVLILPDIHSLIRDADKLDLTTAYLQSSLSKIKFLGLPKT